MSKLTPKLLVLALLVAPAALSPAAAHPAALDIVDVDFSTLPPRWADRTDLQFVTTIRVDDLGLGAPAADGFDNETRYYYEVTFFHNTTLATYTVQCYVHVVDLVVLVNPVGAGNYGISSGCNNVRSSTLGTLFEARMSVDRLADTVTITVSRPYFGGVTLASGTELQDITVCTAGGTVTSTAGSLTAQNPRGPTDECHGPADFTL